MKFVVALFVAVALPTLCGCERAQDPASAPSPDIDVSFELIDETGTAVTSENYNDTLRLVFFGYTSCPDICPITLQNVSMALEALNSPEVTVLFISVDPKRDTPERLKQYTDAFHPSIVGLTGTHDQIKTATTNFRTTFGYSLIAENDQGRPLEPEEYAALAASDPYVPYHSSQVYVIGPDDTLLDIIGYGSKPSQIEETLKKHL